MIILDYNLIKYALEYAAKKMDDYIKEVEAMDAPDVVKDLVIENYQLSKKKYLSMLEKFDYGAKHYRCKNGATYWLCKVCKDKSKYPMDEI